MRSAEEYIPPFSQDTAAFERFIACFPYPVQVFLPDGTLAMVNHAFLNRFDIENPSDVIGRYNVLTDPVAEQYGVADRIRRLFSGETLFEQDIRVPLHLLKRNLKLPAGTKDMRFEDITSFPVTNDDGRMLFVVNVYVGQHKYHEREEIAEAIEQIEAHWKDGFSIEAIAQSVNLSPSYFCRLFKNHTGVTPHEYYTKCKIDRLKEALLDANLTVEQAFTACGVAYHGYYARLFRQKTGYSPSQYRKLART
jgi:AraC family transcriptional regulator